MMMGLNEVGDRTAWEKPLNNLHKQSALHIRPKRFHDYHSIAVVKRKTVSGGWEEIKPFSQSDGCPIAVIVGIREPEFEKRMSFATMVGVTLFEKKTPDEKIATFLPIIEKEAWDDRNFVKKAVNWALRQIGKRSFYLNEMAIEAGERIYAQDSKAAKWIASDALRELRSEKVQIRLRKKS